MSACEDRLVAIIDAASGELSSRDRASFDAHIAGCAGCRLELEELGGTETLLRRTSSAPDDFHLSGFAYRTTMRAEAFRDRSGRGFLWSLTRASRVALGFSTAALAASVTLFVASRQPVPAHEGHVIAVPVPAGESADQQNLSATDDRTDPAMSLDSALDMLSADELDELAAEIGTVPS